MKKIILFVTVVSAFSFASCKKDHTCTCTTTGPGMSGTPQVTTYTKSKKGDVKAACVNGTMVQSGATYTRTCTIK